MWLNKIIFTEDEINNSAPINDYFGMNGYQSMNSIINLGSTYVFLVWLLLSQLLLLLLKIFKCGKSR